MISQSALRGVRGKQGTVYHGRWGVGVDGGDFYETGKVSVEGRYQETGSSSWVHQNRGRGREGSCDSLCEKWVSFNTDRAP